MEQFLFFLVIIIISLMESAARSRRAKQRQQTGEAEPEQFEWAQKDPWEFEQQLPTYDDDPSYDEGPSYDDAPSYDSAHAEQEERPAPIEDRGLTGAEVAADIWAEITGLAKERPKTIQVKVPKQSPDPEPPPRTVRALPARPAHRVHLAHAEYGSDPSERSPSEQDGLDPLAQFLSADARAARDQLRSPGAALRQAIILHEVLGPPKSMQDDEDRWE